MKNLCNKKLPPGGAFRSGDELRESPTSSPDTSHLKPPDSGSATAAGQGPIPARKVEPPSPRAKRLDCGRFSAAFPSSSFSFSSSSSKNPDYEDEDEDEIFRNGTHFNPKMG